MTESLASRYQAAGQGHVFDYEDQLSSEEKQSLYQQLEGIRVEKMETLLQAALEDASKSTSGDIKPFTGPVGRVDDSSTYATSREAGMKALQEGQVAALVLAGGQGTRLGFDGPKGMYNIGLPSEKSLFQLMGERLKKLGELAGAPVPFYIMTSPLNHEETEEFWKANDCFGLGENNVTVFSQGLLPCMKDDGKIIMETAGKVAMAPDGNGGIYPSLQASGSLANMQERGIKYLHVFSIDNALVLPADPVFIGYCVNQKADCGNKVVWKAAANEKVGVIAMKDDKPCVVEYSEISKEMSESTDGNGRLVYGAGNICNHFYTMDFLTESVMPNVGNMYHIARKKIKYYDGKATISPTENTGIKLETFIFDVFPLCENMAVLDVPRSQEFGPVKNKPGSEVDCPETARALISNMCRKWVEDAGGKLSGDADAICEISPLTSYAGEGLEELVKDKTIECPFSL